MIILEQTLINPTIRQLAANLYRLKTIGEAHEHALIQALAYRILEWHRKSVENLSGTSTKVELNQANWFSLLRFYSLLCKQLEQNRASPSETYLHVNVKRTLLKPSELNLREAKA